MDTKLANELGSKAAEQMVKQAFGGLAALGKTVGRSGGFLESLQGLKPFNPITYSAGRYAGPIRSMAMGAGMGGATGFVAAPEGKGFEGAMRGAFLGAGVGGAGRLLQNAARTGQYLPTARYQNVINALRQPNTYLTSAGKGTGLVTTGTLPAGVSARNVTMMDAGGSLGNLKNMLAPQRTYTRLGGALSQGANWVGPRTGATMNNLLEKVRLAKSHPQTYGKLTPTFAEGALNIAVPAGALAAGGYAGATTPIPWYQRLLQSIQ